MGARPSTFSRGGGYLNDVVVTLKGYVFTDAFPNKDGELEPFTPGKIKGFDGKPVEKPHNLNLVWTIRVDDAKEDQYLPLKVASNFDNFEVSEDGLTVTSAEGGRCSINQNTAGAKFIASFVKAGIDAGTFNEDQLSEDEDSINFEPLVDYRCKLVRRVDAERTKKFGGKVIKASNGKAARTVDRDDLLVDEVYAQEGSSAQPTRTTTTASTKVPAKGAKPVAAKGKTAKPAAVDIPALAASTLKDILRENDNTIAKPKLSMKVLLKLTKHPAREDVRKYLFDDANLGNVEGVEYDQESGTLVLSE